MTASDREIVTTRVLAWPRKRVFRDGPNGADYPNQSVKASSIRRISFA
jgi:hypothetical protein